MTDRSLGLINAALKAGQDAGGHQYDDLVLLVERLGVRKLVAVRVCIVLADISV
jgi:hypothetical protein